MLLFVADWICGYGNSAVAVCECWGGVFLTMTKPPVQRKITSRPGEQAQIYGYLTLEIQGLPTVRIHS